MIRFVTSRPSSQTVGQEPLRLRQLLPAFFMLLAMAGVTVQALQGDHGLPGWLDLQTQKTELETHLVSLQRRNADLQMQVSRLHDDSLDLDFLDERVRLVLGLTGKNETVIISQ